MLLQAKGRCASAGEVTVLLCLLVSLLLLRKGFLLPAPLGRLDIELEEMGMVTLRLVEVRVLFGKVSTFDDG